MPFATNIENGTTVGAQTDFLESVLGEAKAVAQQGQLGHVRYSVNLSPNSDGVTDDRWQYLRPRTIALTTTVRF